MAVTGRRSTGHPGTLRVTLARFLLVALAGAPAGIAARAAIGAGPATSPYFVEGEGPLPWLSFVRLMIEIGPAWGAGLAVGLLAALLLDQLLLAGAVRVLSPRRGAWDRPRLAPAIFREGLAHLWPLLRAASIACVAGGAGILLLRSAARQLQLAGQRAGWWSYTLDVRIPLATVLLALLWLALVAAGSLWMRAVIVVDRRRRARRAGAIALSIFRRRPARALLATAAGLLAAALLPGLALGAWRASEPLSATGGALFALVVLLALFAQSWIWTALVRSAVTLYAQPGMEDLRHAPDAPFGLLRRFMERRRRGRSVPAPARERGAAPPA